MHHGLKPDSTVLRTKYEAGPAKLLATLYDKENYVVHIKVVKILKKNSEFSLIPEIPKKSLFNPSINLSIFQQTLQLYQRLGLIVTKIHSAIEFTQECVFKNYTGEFSPEFLNSLNLNS